MQRTVLPLLCLSLLPLGASHAQTATPDSLESRVEALESRWNAFTVFGDARLRAQGDYWNPSADSRHSGQFRLRVGANAAIADNLEAGARMVTGNPDDPNSSDVQLSGFADDFTVSLDQAYLRWTRGGWTLQGGKFPQPFTRTDLVWDGDVNPQGASAAYETDVWHLRSLYFVIDEQAAGDDATMAGVQAGVTLGDSAGWSVSTDLGYYDYSIDSLAAADGGDIRGNRVDASGLYRSDFDLIDLIARLRWVGANARWPLTLTAEAVRNTGAPDDDAAWLLGLQAGRTSRRGDWRLSYAASSADTDAVLAAFSHDNTPLSTDYRLHSVTVDVVPVEHSLLSLYWYHLRAASDAESRWIDRVRLAYLVRF